MKNKKGQTQTLLQKSNKKMDVSSVIGIILILILVIMAIGIILYMVFINGDVPNEDSSIVLSNAENEGFAVDSGANGSIVEDEVFVEEDDSLETSLVIDSDGDSLILSIPALPN